IFATIISQANKEENDEQWLLSLCGKVKARYRRMPRGWWSKIKDAFNQKFGLNESLINVKNRYNRVKAQNDRVEVEGEQSTQDGQPLPTIVTNAEMYSRVRDSLLTNVDKVMSHQQESRQRTRKIYS